MRRLGALAVCVPEDAERLWQRLRLSNAEHERLASMGDGWWRISPEPSGKRRALLYRLGPERFTDRVLLAWTRSPAGIDGSGTGARCCDIAAALDHAGVSAQGRRFHQARRREGPALGAALAAAEEAWIAADFPADEKALAAIMDRAIDAAKRN